MRRGKATGCQTMQQPAWQGLEGVVSGKKPTCLLLQEWNFVEGSIPSSPLDLGKYSFICKNKLLQNTTVIAEGVPQRIVQIFKGTLTNGPKVINGGVAKASSSELLALEVGLSRLLYT